MQEHQLLSQVASISSNIGQWMLQQRVSPELIETKSLNNLVSFVDKGAEERFLTGLSTLIPEAGFIAEEGSGSMNQSGLNWIIDPLDGTTNYLHGIPAWCTSVALIDGSELILGVIHDPNRNETFTAYRDQGAALNGTSFRVSEEKKLSQSLIATGFPYDDFGRQEEYLDLLGFLTKNTRGIRRLGSAALDLAYVAHGRFELFYEYGLNPWDVAAGILIVQEAGGRVSCFDGSNNPIFGDDILASNGFTHDEMMRAIAEFF